METALGRLGVHNSCWNLLIARWSSGVRTGGAVSDAGMLLSV